MLNRVTKKEGVNAKIGLNSCKVELATLNQIETKTRPQVQLISYSRKSTSNLNKISIILIHNEK